jgi:hypothetical protein
VGGPDLIERDLGLGLKADLLRHTGLLRRSASLAQHLRKIQAIGHRKAAIGVASDSDTATWQLSCLPSWPQYCRATPIECLPFLGKPVSSMIQASIGPCRSIAGTTICRTFVSTRSSDQRPSPTKCNSD